MITRNRLIDLVLYDPITGKFVWRYSRRGHVKQYSPIDTIDARGYAVMRLDGKWYTASRLAWLWVYGHWPKHEMDHINMNRRDNRINNLREATRGQNRGNTRAHKHNTHGTKGISRCKWKGKWNGRWVAQIHRNKKQYYLGTFATAEEAHAAYCQAAEKYFGEFARTQ